MAAGGHRDAPRRLRAAEQFLSSALTANVDRPAFLLKLGEKQIQLAKHDEAEKSLREALRLKPDLPMANYDLGVLFEARGDTAKAAEAYEAELQAHPTVYQAHFNLGKILSRVGRANDAVRHFRAAVAANPSFGAGYLYLAKALLDAGELPESEAAALKGLESDAAPEVRPLGHYVLADVYTRMGRAREAARHAALGQRLERGGKVIGEASTHRTRRNLTSLSLVSLVSFVCCDALATPAAATSILFVTIDTLRADRLGVYGATNVETPNIDRLAREGAWARHSTVHVPLTRPSHISMFTGRYPAEHGIRDNVAPALAADVPLAEISNARVSPPPRSCRRSSSRASRVWRAASATTPTRSRIGEDDARFLNTIQKRGDIVTAEAIGWLKSTLGSSPGICYDPHDPYEAPGRYAVHMRTGRTTARWPGPTSSWAGS